MCIRRCCAVALLSAIGHIFKFFWLWFQKHRGYMQCLGVNLRLELKNYTTHSQKTRFSQIYGFKGDDQTVSTSNTTAKCNLYFSCPLKYAVVILVTP